VSTPKITARGIVRAGKIAIRDKRAYDLGIARLLDGQEVMITIGPVERVRSLRQNNFWWGVIVPLFAEHCGYTHEEMHAALKAELLPVRHLLHDQHGEILREIITPGSTASLSTEQFNALIERAQQLGAEMGIVVPDPNQAVA
jgi:hypothetical protein